MNKIKVRYAPSPTGIPHVGNIRTALFNYLFAKNKKGKFILRIEDTDRKRLVPQAEEKIEESLKALNLNWDEKIIQSQRLEIYKKYLDQLKEKKVVYEDEGSWRFKVEKGQELTWSDGVHGAVSFKSDVIEDFVIIKSDGFPTYHFASVVDDHDTQISHVFRGDEWISSTPKHLMIYQSFGWQAPVFVHLPVILGADKKKLSKREGAKTVFEYLEEGLLPETIINFLALLGWSPEGEQEIFSLEELVKEFSIERINKNSPVFNVDKLIWMNGQWIHKRLEVGDLVERINKKFPNLNKKEILEYLPLVRDRLSSIDDYPKITNFLTSEKINIDPNKIILPADKLVKIKNEYKVIDPLKWDKTFIGNATASVIQHEGLSKGETLSSIGTAVSGSTVTPPIYDSLEKLGKEKTLERLDEAIRKKTQK
ncbi:glutamate--tRNA ligase [Candidatus Curtissbacteria bacterium]|nr:glutamate--tRNA ligase [Candidatus Curtissbacteria bacterium]